MKTSADKFVSRGFLPFCHTNQIGTLFVYNKVETQSPETKQKKQFKI